MCYLCEMTKNKVTLSFYKRLQGSAIELLKSSGQEYESVEAARAAAKEALESFNFIAFVDIKSQPVSGHSQILETVRRE